MSIILILLATRYFDLIPNEGQASTFVKPHSNERRLMEPRSRQAFVMVSDRDHDSRHPEQFEWTAFIQHGTVTRQPDGRYRIAFGEVDSVSSQSAFNNRSLELSEAVVYGDKLLVMCDVSGTVYELDLASKTLSFFSQHMFTGHGLTKKPFKVEWATVKDGDLILGSIGKEWVHRRQAVSYTHLTLPTIA